MDDEDLLINKIERHYLDLRSALSNARLSLGNVRRILALIRDELPARLPPLAQGKEADPRDVQAVRHRRMLSEALEEIERG